MKGGSVDVTSSLRQLRQAVSATDLSRHDASSLRSLIGELRLTERSLTALSVKAARQSDVLAAEGAAPDAEETLLGTGDVSGSTARKERNRSRIADAIPQAGDALDQGTIDVGRQYRTATKRQWVALESIYTCCGWAGCDRPITWCQGIRLRRNSSCSLRSQHRPSNHLTTDNLIPLCSRHHHAVHEGQWTIKLLPDRTLRIFQPNGQHHANALPDRVFGDGAFGEPPGHREPTHN